MSVIQPTKYMIGGSNDAEKEKKRNRCTNKQLQTKCFSWYAHTITNAAWYSS